jgi:hypothetical protein
MRRCYFVIGLGLLIGLASVTYGEKETSRQVTTMTSSAPNFIGLTEKAASEAADAIVANHRTMEQELTTQLDAEKTPDKYKVLLIYTLGQLRSTWAVPSLVNIVDFRAPFRDGPPSDIGRWGEYPAVDALTAIGTPAVRHIVEVLATEQNAARVRLMLTIIWQVEGRKPGQAWIEAALAAAKEDSAKKNLQNALKAYQTLVSELEK